jgi:propanol-preferring alcohol dehydrogenase
MKAMLLREIASLARNPAPLILADLREPEPAAGEVVIRVSACGVCHTELDEIEGRTPPAHLPVIPGHQVVGTVTASAGQDGLEPGDRVGVAWIYSACGQCKFCLSGRENLCLEFRATGRDADGGYAQYMRVPAAFAHPLPASIGDAEAAPLLCAGAVGWRALRLTGLRDGESLGLTGFGASNHLVLKMARYQFPGSRIFVFSRNAGEREFALSLGAAWAGGIEATPPEQLQAVIDATPAWRPVLEALKHLERGGRLVINAIRKEGADRQALPELDYASQLWHEKEIKSVANVTRRDVREVLDMAAASGLRPEIQEYPLEQANQALLDLREGRIRGAKVLRI